MKCSHRLRNTAISRQPISLLAILTFSIKAVFKNNYGGYRWSLEWIKPLCRSVPTGAAQFVISSVGVQPYVRSPEADLSNPLSLWLAAVSLHEEQEDITVPIVLATQPPTAISWMKKMPKKTCSHQNTWEHFPVVENPGIRWHQHPQLSVQLSCPLSVPNFKITPVFCSDIYGDCSNRNNARYWFFGTNLRDDSHLWAKIVKANCGDVNVVNGDGSWLWLNHPEERKRKRRFSGTSPAH